MSPKPVCSLFRQTHRGRIRRGRSPRRPYRQSLQKARVCLQVPTIQRYWVELRSAITLTCGDIPRAVGSSRNHRFISRESGWPEVVHHVDERARGSSATRSFSSGAAPRRKPGVVGDHGADPDSHARLGIQIPVGDASFRPLFRQLRKTVDYESLLIHNSSFHSRSLRRPATDVVS